MKHFIYIIALLATGCGAEKDEPKSFDPVLAPIVYEYLAYAPNKGHLDKLVKMEFGDLGGRAGHCHRYDKGSPFETRTITIAPREEHGWIFKSIVMHELAHCLHDIEHSDDQESLMYHEVWGDEDYWRENLEAKVRELF